jgi:hypothetical protein
VEGEIRNKHLAADDLIDVPVSVVEFIAGKIVEFRGLG